MIFLCGYNVFCLSVANAEINWMLRNRGVSEITQRKVQRVNKFRLHDFVHTAQCIKRSAMFKEREKQKPFTLIFVSLKHDPTNKRLSSDENKRR